MSEENKVDVENEVEDEKVDVADLAAKSAVGIKSEPIRDGQNVKTTTLDKIKKLVKPDGPLAKDKIKVILVIGDEEEAIIFRNMMVSDEAHINNSLISERVSKALVDPDADQKQVMKQYFKEVAEKEKEKMYKAVLLCWEDPEGITMDLLEQFDPIWIEQIYHLIKRKKEQSTVVDLFRGVDE